MPAASDRSPEPAVSLPQRFRPLGTRLALLFLGGLLVVLVVGIWFAFPPEVRDQFTAFQELTLGAIALVLLVIAYAIGRCRVDVRAEGVTVVNGYRVRRFEWNQVLAVSLRRGSPWAVLDLSDGTSVAAMGIQGSDGQRALSQVRTLRRLVDELTRPQRDT